MLTGRKAFGGESVSDTLAAVLKEDPDWSALPAGRPRGLRRVLEQCLRKDPRQRLHHPADVRILLEEAPAVRRETASAKMPRWGLPALAGLGLAVVVLAAMQLGGRKGSGTGSATPSVRFSQQTYYAGVETNPALSPDGTLLAYAAAPDGGDLDIFLERVGGRKPINLTADSEDDDYMPAFSPDGESIAFRSDRSGGGIFIMGATGESVRRLTDKGADPAWSPDGTRVAFSDEGVFNPMSRGGSAALWVADLATGETRRLYDAEDAVHPSWSPNGHRIAVWGAGNNTGQRDVFTVATDGTGRVDVTRDIDVDWNPIWSADGKHLYFASDRGGSMNLWRVSIDGSTGRVLGEPEALPTPARWSGPLALSSVGQIAFVAAARRSNLFRAPFDPVVGKFSGPPEAVTRGTLPVWQHRASPDGEWIVFNSGKEVQEDLYLVRADGTGLRKLTHDRHRDRGPSWSPDGDSILFQSNRTGSYQLWSIRPDGSGVQQLSSLETGLWFPNLSQDLKRLIAFNLEGTRAFELEKEGLLAAEDSVLLPRVGKDEAVFQGWAWSSDDRYLSGGLLLSEGIPVFDFERDEYRVFDAPGAHRPRRPLALLHCRLRRGGHLDRRDRVSGAGCRGVRTSRSAMTDHCCAAPSPRCLHDRGELQSIPESRTHRLDHRRVDPVNVPRVRLVPAVARAAREEEVAAVGSPHRAVVEQVAVDRRRKQLRFAPGPVVLTEGDVEVAVADAAGPPRGHDQPALVGSDVRVPLAVLAVDRRAEVDGLVEAAVRTPLCAPDVGLSQSTGAVR
jgi:Tol biopolymer transport system component